MGWRLARTLLFVSALQFCADARSEIKIEIPEVTEAIQNNIRAYLSLTRYADRKDITPEVMSRLQRRIVSEARKGLEPLGYYEPEIKYEVSREGETWIVRIFVNPGRPVRLSEVNIQVTGAGAQARDVREVIAKQDLKPGLRLNHGAYEKLKDDLIRAAKNDGYLDAKLVRNELLIDRTARRATVSVDLETGERYSFGEITIVQDVVTDEAMRKLLRMKTGDPYTLDTLLRSQYVLDDTQYFQSVDIESQEPDRQARVVPMMVRAEPNRKHRYAISAGYGTDTKARGKFTWDNRRVNREGNRSKLELTGSDVVTEITGRYVIPVMDIALEKLEFTATIKEEELGDTLSEKAEIGAGLTQAFGRWQRVLFTLLSYEETTVPDAAGTGTDKSDAFLLIPGISFATLPSYITGGRARPYNLYAELRGSPSTFGSDASFLQFRAQGERIYDLSDVWKLNLRAQLGVSWVADFTELPASQRFFAGGDRSVRGFGLNELSPKDANGNDIGGENLATASIEIERILPRNFGVAAFYDIGNAFNSFEDPQFEYSVGLGMRYHIAVAAFGIDVAQPLSEPGRGPKLHLFISTVF